MSRGNMKKTTTETGPVQEQNHLKTAVFKEPGSEQNPIWLITLNLNDFHLRQLQFTFTLKGSDHFRYMPEARDNVSSFTAVGSPLCFTSLEFTK